MTIDVQFIDEPSISVSFADSDDSISVGVDDAENVLDVQFNSLQTLYRGQSSDYATLRGKPRINEHELVSGENSLAQIGIGRAANRDINRMF